MATTSSSSTSSTRPPTMAYICPVVLDSVRPPGSTPQEAVDATQKAFDAFALKWFPSKAVADHKCHASVLCHGPDGAAELNKDENDIAALHPETMTGTINGVNKYASTDNSGRTRHYVTVCFDCDNHELEKLSVRLRADARRITGADSWQRPHLGPDGAHIYYNDVHPHITVATYDDLAAAEREFKTMTSVVGQAELLGQRVTLLPVRKSYR